MSNCLTPLRHSQKEKCESLGSYTGTGFTSIFAGVDFDTLDEQISLEYRYRLSLTDRSDMAIMGTSKNFQILL